MSCHQRFGLSTLSAWERVSSGEYAGAMRDISPEGSHGELGGARFILGNATAKVRYGCVA